MQHAVKHQTNPVLAKADALSALMDGELSETESAQMIERLQHGDERALWQSWHVIGDCLRGTPPLKSDLSNRISLLLADEPTVLAPHRRAGFLRFGMPVAASVAAVMLVAWGAFNFAPSASLPGLAGGQQLADATPVQSSFNQRHDVSDYLVAHRDFSPGEMVSPLANVNYEVAADNTK
jgi:sigma-E factor negative regulatory protein RseA